MIDKANGEAPWVSVPGRSSQILADPPYVRVSEERLPRYLNPAVDYGPIQQGISAGQQVQVIDDFLTPAALDQLRKFCLESTVWRHPYKFGYVGAFPQDGFASVSLFAIAEELLAALGEAFDGYQLAQWWGFVYDSNLPGTDIHGDDADFSLNLWITPDSANLDPSSGGLVVWDKTAPSDWTFDHYNSGGDRVRQYLEEHNAESQVIPHRANRAVLFEGHLFHRTDRVQLRARVRQSATQPDLLISTQQAVMTPRPAANACRGPVVACNPRRYGPLTGKILSAATLLTGRRYVTARGDSVGPRPLRLVSGDGYSDWEAVYQDNATWVYRTIYARVGNRADAEDLTAEVFLAALRPLRLTASIGEVRGYLRATARTVLAAHWRETLGREITSIDDIEQPPESEQAISTAPQRVAGVLGQLPDNYRRILELRFLQGRSIKESAAEMGVSVANAKVLQHRALRLAAQVNEKGGS